MADPQRKLVASILALTAVASLVMRADSVRAQPAPAQSAAMLAESLTPLNRPGNPPGQGILTAADEAFLDALTKDGIRFFTDYADPESGLMPDRGRADGSKAGDVASIASVGFGISALCVGVERGWVEKQDAYNRIHKVLRFLKDKAEHKHGHFYHFLDMRTGARAWNCEISNIDTALLMTGVLTARQYFPDTELAKLCSELYERVQWGFLMTEDGTLSMGWKPESGFIEAKWNHYSEGAPLIVLLGLGSPTHPLPPEAWHAWKRDSVGTYAGLTYLQCAPLFTHQFPQCWFDLRGLRDDYADYFKNSQLATIAQRQWTIDELSKRFSTYGPDMWGLTASDTANGYKAWGGPPKEGHAMDEHIDGSVVPCAPAGSLVFAPRQCLDALLAMKQRYGEKAYLTFGFVDAFNPGTGWYNEDVIGIDVGPTVLMAENLRTGFVWKTFMSAPEMQLALKKAGFRPIGPSDALPATTSLYPQPGQTNGAAEKAR